MTSGARAAWVAPLAGLVGRRLGLAFPRERWDDLERGIRDAARERGVPDADAFACGLLDAPADDALSETLACALTVGETYFFREPRSFEVLEHDILPRLIAARAAAGGPLRLWSAGCCTGEEAYSLAIVVDRLLPRRRAGQVTIVGTDVNRRFLDAAARGEFGAWSFRDAPAGLRERYFRPIGAQRFAIDPRIRAMVTFAPLNLARPFAARWPGGVDAFDVIFCRNVLMYFAPEQRQKVLEGFRQVLSDDGCLSIGATETLLDLPPGLHRAPLPGVAFYRRGPDEGPAAAAPASAASVAPAAGVSATVPPAAAPAMAVPHAPSAAPAAPATPDPALGRLEQARAHADAGRLDLARQAIEQALGPAKLDAGAHYLHAVILQELGRDAEAREALRCALYLQPDLVMAHQALGQLARRKGLDAQAKRHFGHALRLLAGMDPQAIVPHSGSLSAAHLQALIEAALAAGRRP